MVPFDRSVPRAKGTFVSPEGGVARTVPPYTAAPRTLRRRTQIHFDFTSPPFPPSRARRSRRGTPKDYVSIDSSTGGAGCRGRTERVALPPFQRQHPPLE